MHPYHIVLADDHVLFRKGLRRILTGMDNLIEVIGEAGDGIELLKLLNALTPHMVILDISMPNLRGIEAIHEIKMTHPEIEVLILTMHKDMEYLHLCISAGADGYLLKEDADTDLLSAINAIRDGKTYFSPLLSADLTYNLTQTWRGKTTFSLRQENLTTREREVLKLVAEGKSSRQIADLLFISIRTVERHRANILEKLDMKKTADLVKYAIQKGYI